MNKAQLVSAVAEITKLTKDQTEQTIETFLSVIRDNIKSKDGVRLPNFGTFTFAHRSARTGRNPHTGKELEIPARDVPVFRPASKLKEACDIVSPDTDAEAEG